MSKDGSASFGWQPDEAMRKYMQTVQGVAIANEFEDDDERVVFATNVFNELNLSNPENTRKLCCHPDASRLVEQLLTFFSEENQLSLCRACIDNLGHIAVSPFGSHALQKILLSVRGICSKGSDEAAACVLAAADAALLSWAEIMVDPRGSFVLRTLIACLCGYLCSEKDLKAFIFSDKMASFATPEAFRWKLSSICDGLVTQAADALPYWCKQAPSSVIIQFLLIAVKKFDPIASDRLVRAICCAEATCQKINPDSILKMIRHPVASHAVELCFSGLHAQLWRELYSTIFQSRISALSLHQFATFPLQSFVAAAPERQDLDSVFCEIEATFAQLLQTRPTVITSLLLACSRLQHKQSEALALLLSSSGAKSMKAMIPQLLNVAAPAAANSYEPQRCALASAVMSLHGDAKRDIRDAADALDASLLLSLCHSSAASKFVCSLLCSPALQQKHKDSIVGKLLAHASSLVCTATGSHVIDSCFDASSIDYREKLVACLAGDAIAVRRSFFGSLTLRHIFCFFQQTAPLTLTFFRVQSRISVQA
jgi:hypothetical protein